nr:MAG TPA_asm: hypothetical protein [Caudoviricetes sp.]
MLRSAEFSASINSNAGNPFIRSDQQEILKALRLIPRGFFVLNTTESLLSCPA